MMKKFFYMAVAAIAALSSCSSDDAILGEEGKQNEGANTFTATTEEEDATTRTTYDSSTHRAVWTSTDEINVGGAVYTVSELKGYTADFTGTGAQKSGEVYKAYYPAAMYNEGTVTLPASYTLPDSYFSSPRGFNMPMYSESATTDLFFKNLCGVLAIKVLKSDFSSVGSVTVYSDQRLNGEFTVAMSEGVPTLNFTSTAPATAEEKRVVLAFNSFKDIYQPDETIYVPIPAGTHHTLTIKISNGTTKSYVMETKKTGGITIERNKLYKFTFKANVENLMLGDFSVGDTKKVKFAKSNLYWNGTDYKFEASQTAYPVQSDYTSSTEGWIGTHVGHFYWTSYTDYNNNVYPYRNTYSHSYMTDASADDEFFCSENHTLTVEGTTGLYALSKAEWEYLLNTSNATSGARQGNRFAKAKYNDVRGLLIFPDGYKDQTVIGATGTATVNSASAYYPEANMTDEAWNRVTLDGVVFLPVTGTRTGSSATIENKNGYYWASTIYSPTYSDDLMFSNDHLYVSSKTREVGLPIRLVK